MGRHRPNRSGRTWRRAASSSCSRSSSTCTRRPSAKLVPVGSREAFDGLARRRCRASPASPPGEIGQMPSDPDIAAIPDLDELHARSRGSRTSRASPATSPSRARSGRTARARSCGACSRERRSKGFEFKMGLELEYFLVEQREDGAIEIADAHDTLEKPCYDMAGPDAPLRLPDDRSRATATSSAGATTRTTTRTRTASSSRTSRTTTPSSSCDRAIFFRYMVHTLAEQNGMIATFMPKPFTAPDRERLPLPHVALGRRRRNLFLDEADPRGLGLSDTAYHFIGGLKTHARAYSARDRADGQLVQAAQARDDRRAAPRGRRCGSRYGYNNRTQMLRIPAPGRIEDRTIDGSVQPVPRRGGCAGGRARRHRERPRRRRAELGQPLLDSRTTSCAAAGLETLPANLARGDDASSSSDDVPARGARRGAGRGLRRLLHRA